MKINDEVCKKNIVDFTYFTYKRQGRSLDFITCLQT